MKWHLAVIGILALGCALPEAPAQTLVRVGESWKFLRGLREPATPPAAWTMVGFDDSAWESGLSGFGPVYPQAATQLYDMPGAYTSVYLRRSFLVERPQDLTWLILRADYGGGFVVYLNGREVLRRGLPGVPNSWIPHDAVSEPHSYGRAEEFDLSAFIPLIKPGPNLIAIQAHSSALDSYTFCIVPELTANFTRQPVLQNVSSNQAVILWRSIVPSDSQVAYGRTPELGLTQTVTNLGIEHAIQLTGLEPGQEYYYQVASSAGDRWARSETNRFRTLKTDGPLSFVVLGDSGSGAEAQYRVAQVMRESSPDLVLHLGDVMYPYFTLGQVETKCFSVYEPQMRHTPFFFVVGNHDRYGIPTDFFDAFYMPTNPVTGTEVYFSFDHGDAHFACLDSDLQGGTDYSVGSPQYQWLDADLAATRKPWKFIFLHNTVRSSGIHRNDDWDNNGVFDRVQLQESVERLAARRQVQVIFQAHDHLYERFNPVNGVHLLTSGGGGYALYPFGGAWDEATCQFRSVHHCVHVTVDGDELETRALDLNGAVFDRMFLRRTPTPRRLYVSAWHTPRTDGEGPPDGDGNHEGQQFDRVGDPIPAQAGAWANLGRLYVNNDGQDLHLGLRGFYPTLIALDLWKG